MIQSLQAITGIIAGSLIGFSFGWLQDAAWRRYRRLQNLGELNSSFGTMPGSMRRVAYLLVCLAAIQFLCPLLFADGTQWWVTGGVLAGYGAMLYRSLREKLNHRS